MRAAPRAPTPTAVPSASAVRVEAAEWEAWRAAMVVRLVLMLVAAAVLLLAWRPAVVRAQGRPGARPDPGAVMGTTPSPGAGVGASLARQTAGLQDAPPVAPATRGVGGAVVNGPTGERPPEAPRVAATVAATVSAIPTTVPYRGALLASPEGQDGVVDTARTVFAQRGGAGPSAAGGRGIGLVRGEEQRAARQQGEEPTVFHRDLPDPFEAERRMRALLDPNTPAPRTGEYLAAPFVVDAATLSRVPVLGTTHATLAEGEPFPRRYRVDDEVLVRLPAGSAVTPGARLAAVVPVGMLDGAARVVAPTGVLEVRRVRSGVAVAVVRSQSAVIAEGQLLVPVRGRAAPWQPVERLEGDNLESAVPWVAQADRVQGPQGFVLLAVGERQGVRAGDRFVLQSRGPGAAPEGETVAVVRVVRVDDAWSSAKVTYLQDAEWPAALVARRIGRSAPGAMGQAP